MLQRAIVRGVPTSFASAISSTAPTMPIDTGLARTQHAAYCMALEAIGLEVTTIPADDRHPDCCFIEDTAVIAAGLALITRPGAPSRQGEPAAVAPVLAAHLELATMTQPATLDGGDCMQVGTTLYVGRSTRTNAAGIARVAEVFAPRGLRVVAVDVPSGVLHLKCVCSPLGGDRLLLARDSIPSSVFGRADIVWVPASETFAANAVALGTHVVVAAEYPRTRDALAAAGFETHAIATTEIRKADGSLTCQSLVLEAA